MGKVLPKTLVYPIQPLVFPYVGAPPNPKWCEVGHFSPILYFIFIPRTANDVLLSSCMALHLFVFLLPFSYFLLWPVGFRGSPISLNTFKLR
jgi:hypothetical protein